MYHTVFIHLFVNGHLGCFHAVAIINSDAMNIGVHVRTYLLGLWLSPVICPGVGLLMLAQHCKSTILQKKKFFFLIFMNNNNKKNMGDMESHETL